jgi:prepilin peptidase CpaA
VNEKLLMVFALIFVCSVLYAMISDFSRLRIPNIVSIVLVAAFAVFALLGGTGNFWPHLILAGVVLATLFVFFAMGWMGAGDVKLLSALMLWAGPAQGSRFVVLFAIFGGIFAMGLLALRTALPYYPILSELPVMSKFSRWARNGLIPYGIPIGVAALCVAPSIFAVR